MTGKILNRHPIFFGCPLDPDERDESLQEKTCLTGPAQPGGDPYYAVMQLVHNEIGGHFWEERGSIEVPPWIRPIPPVSMQRDVLLENIVRFIDGDGCLDFAQLVSRFIEECILPEIPCMIAVDHSLTGGSFASLVGFYKPDDISLIVVDSHVDALPTGAMSEAIEFDMATNPNSVYDPSDPFLRNRPDSYNASSFIYYLLEEGLIDPRNLYLVGVSDYPPKKAFRIKDGRIKHYLDCYSSLKRNGVKILTKKDLSLGPTTLTNVIRRISTPYVYISIDMDIGARNALNGVRFLNHQGINENQIYRIALNLRELIDRGVRLAGMDLMEFNPRRAGYGETQGDDRTYRIAFNLIKTICFKQ